MFIQTAKLLSLMGFMIMKRYKSELRKSVCRPGTTTVPKPSPALCRVLYEPCDPGFLQQPHKLGTPSVPILQKRKMRPRCSDNWVVGPGFETSLSEATVHTPDDDRTLSCFLTFSFINSYFIDGDDSLVI